MKEARCILGPGAQKFHIPEVVLDCMARPAHSRALHDKGAETEFLFHLRVFSLTTLIDYLQETFTLDYSPTSNFSHQEFTQELWNRYTFILSFQWHTGSLVLFISFIISNLSAVPGATVNRKHK